MTIKSIPMYEIKQNLKDILLKLEASGEPYFITQRNRPKAVLMRYEDYNALVEQAGARQPRIIRRPDVSGGEPIIHGTRISVRDIVERVQAHQSVEDILAALPHLTAAQCYAALAYYHDHRSELDRLIVESQPDRIIAARGLQVEKVADGVAVARDNTGR